MSEADQDVAYRRVINSWAMYDWANSAFYTTIVASVYPLFYRMLAEEAGIKGAEATAYWAYTASAALLLVALVGPVLGAISDCTGGKKTYIAFFTGIGVVSCCLMFGLGEDSYLTASALFIMGTLGVAGANVFYESLLPHIAQKGDIDQISTRGYALGYLGGGILLVLNILWITFPDTFFFPSRETAIRTSFLSVGVWWGLFSIPLFKNVPEPAALPLGELEVNPVTAGFRRLGNTFREIRKYRQLLLLLVAFWLYNDGIGTIMKMAAAYGDEIGIGMTDLILALVITQFVGIPCAFAFGWLAGRIGAKHSILIGLFVYSAISVGAFYLETAVHFYILALMVGLVQGGTQALSRSLYGTMVPRARSAELFGFLSTSTKFAGILGPLLFGLISQATGSSRLSIFSLLVFFLGGASLLLLVDVEEGRRVAREEDAALPGRAVEFCDKP